MVPQVEHAGWQVELADGVAVVRFPSPTLSEGGMRELRQEFIRLAHEESRGLDLRLDLGSVAFTTPGGLGGLVALDIAVRHTGGRLTLCQVTPGIYEVLRLARLTAVLDVAPAARYSGVRRTI